MATAQLYRPALPTLAPSNDHTFDAPTMSSFTLLEIVNAARREFGEVEVRRNDFTARCRDELAGDHYETIVVKNPNGTQSDDLLLTRDQCLYVAMRESKAVRRQVTVKLNESVTPQVPRTLAQALRLAADQAEQIEQQAAALVLAAPKVEFHDKYAVSTGNKGVREVAKLLGANERQFIAWLTREDGPMYRLAGVLTPKAPHMGTGRFVVKAGTADHGGDNSHAFNQAKFTPKGVTWIAGEWGKRNVALAA